MALASEDEWETDPELKAMRAEFVASFAERRARLELVLPVLRAAASAPATSAATVAAALKEAIHVAHKVAGSAETYGFPLLTRAASTLEDWHQHAGARPGAASVCVPWVELLAWMLDETARAGRNVPAHAEDPRFKTLVAAATAAAQAVQTG